MLPYVYAMDMYMYINSVPTVDQVSLSSDSYEVSEGAGRVTIFLMRTGDLSESTTVQLRTRSLPGENTAQGTPT